MSILDLDRLRAQPLCREPFDFVIVENFFCADRLPAVLADFPDISRHGSFPLASLSSGPAVMALAEELEGEALRSEIEAKFTIDLRDRPTMITVRGRSDDKDGRIHTDSASKLITLLIYLNQGWDSGVGRLRLLRRPDDLDDYVAEIPPVAGMMVAFRRGENSFHGHYPHRGERRSVQLNWVTDARVVQRELGRHAWSARLKSLNPFGRGERVAL
ncbi:MAG: 2OG-Fe(II) oxygenase [Alphaproteobacteria bacterium]|nr:2OG-Fe(II) oxygenase [Alphaproteobacteria bacterium]